MDASENPFDREEAMNNAMLIASPLVRLYRTASLNSQRKQLVPPHLVKAHLSLHSMQGASMPSDARMRENNSAPNNTAIAWLKTVAGNQDMRYAAWKEIAKNR